MNGDKSRDDILEAIRLHEGLKKSWIMDEVSLGWGATRHHLDILESQDLVDKVQLNNECWYFDPYVRSEERRIIAMVMGNKNREKIAKLTLTGRSADEVSELSRLAGRTIRKHLTKLEAVGAVSRFGFPAKFLATDALRAIFRRRKD